MTSRERAEERMRWYAARFRWTGLSVYEGTDGEWYCTGDGTYEDVCRAEKEQERKDRDDTMDSRRHDR